jgi:hypothetical protein
MITIRTFSFRGHVIETARHADGTWSATVDGHEIPVTNHNAWDTYLDATRWVRRRRKVAAA